MPTARASPPAHGCMRRALRACDTTGQHQARVTAMGATGHPSCSVGVAALGEGESADRLMARADRALYAAKRAGVGRVVADHAAVDPGAAPRRSVASTS